MAGLFKRTTEQSEARKAEKLLIIEYMQVTRAKDEPFFNQKLSELQSGGRDTIFLCSLLVNLSHAKTHTISKDFDASKWTVSKFLEEERKRLNGEAVDKQALKDAKVFLTKRFKNTKIKEAKEAKEAKDITSKDVNIITELVKLNTIRKILDSKNLEDGALNDSGQEALLSSIPVGRAIPYLSTKQLQSLSNLINKQEGLEEKILHKAQQSLKVTSDKSEDSKKDSKQLFSYTNGMNLTKLLECVEHVIKIRITADTEPLVDSKDYEATQRDTAA